MKWQVSIIAQCVGGAYETRKIKILYMADVGRHGYRRSDDHVSRPHLHGYQLHQSSAGRPPLRGGATGIGGVSMTVIVHAHWAMVDEATEIYLVGKFLYFYHVDEVPNFRVGDHITKADIGHPFKWQGWSWQNIPQGAIRLFK